jgi:hypothetical protein
VLHQQTEARATTQDIGGYGFSTVANQAPVVTGATATPSAVSGSGGSTALTATATDDAGEAALIYTWSATGPAAVAFAPNATNAAKASTATFSADGTCVLTVTARDAGGLSGTRSVTVVVGSLTQRRLRVSLTDASGGLPGSVRLDGGDWLVLDGNGQASLPSTHVEVDHLIEITGLGGDG